MFVFLYVVNRSIETLQNKWKTIKTAAKKRNGLTRKLQLTTGGGALKDSEKRIVESNLYHDVVAKLGIAAIGAEPRFDSDQT